MSASPRRPPCPPPCPPHYRPIPTFPPLPPRFRSRRVRFQRLAGLDGFMGSGAASSASPSAAAASAPDPTLEIYKAELQRHDLGVELQTRGAGAPVTALRGDSGGRLVTAEAHHAEQFKRSMATGHAEDDKILDAIYAAQRKAYGYDAAPPAAFASAPAAGGSSAGVSNPLHGGSSDDEEDEVPLALHGGQGSSSPRSPTISQVL